MATQTTQTVNINLGERSYPIHVRAGLMADFGAILRAAGLSGHVVVVSDDRILSHYREPVLRSLTDAGFAVDMVALPEGEEHKSLVSAEKLWNALIDLGATRKTVVMALGGGVVGDVAGFVASTFMRGVAFVQAPTSMIGQLDSSIGGKNGVNFPQAKNIVGSFYQPKMVLTDPVFLKTLPKRELLSGFGEVVKYALLTDDALFDYVENNTGAMLAMDEPCLERLIVTCSRYKAKLIEIDERDQGPRAVLNLGHTIGHAIEKVAGYGKYRHGEAVAAGLVYALKLSKRMNVLEDGALAGRTEALVARLELPTAARDVSPGEIVEAVRLDKKITVAGESKFILQKKIGSVVTVPVPEHVIKETLQQS